MNLADYQIRKKIQGGDIHEFEHLFLEYFKPLCRQAYLLLGDMDQAEDIVQEFFYNFWKNREEIIINSSLNAYLFQSIRNNAIRCLEQQALKREYTEQLNTGTLAGT
jgi:RNA polymerase sigma-70 factor (ECF subfamily)